MSIGFRLSGVVSLFAALVLAASPASAQRRSADQWVKLGEQTVGFGVDRDVIQVGREEGRFRAVKLIVRRNDVFLNDLRVTYRNGETEDLAVNRPIRNGGETGTLNLTPGNRGSGARVIEKVDLVYKSRPGFGGQAVAELWGLRASDDWGGGPVAGGPGYGAYGGPPPQRVYGGEIPRGWVLFGSQTVGFQAERDVIRLGRDQGRFGKIAFRVLKNDVFMREIVINYSRGETQRIPINAEIQANGVTQPVDIKDGRIENIQLVYQARPNFRGQAVVEVYGEHAASWTGGGGDNRPTHGQWVLLGAQRAEMLKEDRDVFPVGQQAGRFRQVKIRAVGHAIDLFGMHVTYGNGESEDVQVPRSLRGGQETPAIDLRGRERFIENIELRYRTKPNFGGSATVEVHGLH